MEFLSRNATWAEVESLSLLKRIHKIYTPYWNNSSIFSNKPFTPPAWKRTITKDKVVTAHLLCVRPVDAAKIIMRTVSCVYAHVSRICSNSMQSHRYEHKIAGDTSNHDDIRIHVPRSKLFTMLSDLPLMHLDKALWFSAKCIVRTPKYLSSKEHMPQLRCTSFMLDHVVCYLSNGTKTPTIQHSYCICRAEEMYAPMLHAKSCKPCKTYNAQLSSMMGTGPLNVQYLHTDETVRSLSKET